MHISYALLLVELNDSEEAKNNFDKVTEINQNYAPAYFHKVRLLTNADDFEEARKNYETALDIDENFTEAHYYMGKLLSGGVATDKEGTLIDRTNLPQAKEHYLQVLQIDPGHTKALYNLANILSTEKNYEEAKKHLLNALEIDASYSKAHYLLAVYVECEKKEKAKEHFYFPSSTLPTMPWPTSGWASFSRKMKWKEPNTSGSPLPSIRIMLRPIFTWR